VGNTVGNIALGLFGTCFFGWLRHGIWPAGQVRVREKAEGKGD